MLISIHILLYFNRRVDILTGLGGDDLLPRDVTRDIPVIELTRTSPDQIHRQSTPGSIYIPVIELTRTSPDQIHRQSTQGSIYNGFINKVESQILTHKMGFIFKGY